MFKKLPMAEANYKTAFDAQKNPRRESVLPEN
jgi:hypothetical protein